jgi:hypothetical protein
LGWTPFRSGAYFFGVESEKMAIEFFDLETKKARVVYVMEKDTPGWVGGLAVSSDGKWLLFPQMDEQSSDLMMIENWN